MGPHAIFFFSCASIMAIELVASRLIASHLGSSLYTWSAVIGVMLAGISAGNVIGGRLADRFGPERILPGLFLAAAAACAAVLGLNDLFAATRPLQGLPWPLQILASVVAIFVLPAIALGTLSPSLAKIAVERGRGVGGALGAFYAWGTVGSIVGTLFTGFWLLFVLGNTRLVVLVSGVLAVLGGAARIGFRTGRRRLLLRDPVPSAGAAVGAAGMTEDAGPVSWTGIPHAIAFFSAACLMIVELIASRIIADQAGNSLYSWTSVIGVVLAGMSLGNYLGGRLSDRLAPSRFMGGAFVAASASCVAVLFGSYAFSISNPFPGWHWPAIVFTTVACLFFVPSVLLGLFTPAAMKVAVQRGRGVGSAIGSVSAWNTAGSIVGTLASGFWLISAVGSRSLTMLVAVLLAGAGLALGPRRRLQRVWLVVACAGFVLTRVDVPVIGAWSHAGIFRPSSSDLFDADSAYQHIRVFEEASQDEPERVLRVLSLDYLIHGYVDVEDPAFLNYDYERVYRDVAFRYAGDKTRVSAFFLGGGSYTFPRWVMAQWPGSVPEVAEIDPLVLEANYQALGLPRNTAIRTTIGDARNTVDRLPEGRRFDFFFGDAFNDLSIPYHLTTLEFTRKLAAHLQPDGAYLVNVIDSAESGLLLGAFVNTLRQVFVHVYVFCTERDGPRRERDTYVVAASNVPLDTSGWEPHHQGDFEGSRLTDADLAALARKAGGRILTDDNAPVENLIAPVVRQRTGADR